MFKRILLAFIALLILMPNYQAEASPRKTSYSKSHSKVRQPKNSYKPKTAKKYKSYSTPKTNYKPAKLKIKDSEFYKSTGLLKVDRSESEKNEFLKSRGLEKTPAGYEVDHIVPLSKGGADKSWNMQLLPKELHKQKTANERKK